MPPQRPTKATIRRRRLTAAAVLAGLWAIAALAATGGFGHGGHRHGAVGTTVVGVAAAPPATVAQSTTSGTRSSSRPRRASRFGPFPVAETTIRIVDRSRTVTTASAGRGPRTVLTYIRYPTDRTAGPFPLLVFGHGFAVTPGIYAALLRDWARAGFVVAAPVYPLGNANAPGGPNESDLPNQPADDSLVITRLLADSRSPSGVLHGLIDPRQIAVSGQSDGGDTALAAGYDPPYRDRRIGAVIVLSGAEIPFVPTFRIAPGGPPLLATQGGADTINPPSQTHAFYDSAPPPKFLLWLPGIGHLPPYTTAEPQLSIVARVSTLFLRSYLQHVPDALGRMLAAGNRPGVASITGHR